MVLFIETWSALARRMHDGNHVPSSQHRPRISVPWVRKAHARSGRRNTGYISLPALQQLTKPLECADKYMQLEPVQVRRQRAEADLLKFGFKQKDFQRPARQLSGGWRIRVELAMARHAQAQVLLLDEPTNHLDLPGVLQLKAVIESLEVCAAIPKHIFCSGCSLTFLLFWGLCPQGLLLSLAFPVATLHCSLQVTVEWLK